MCFIIVSTNWRKTNFTHNLGEKIQENKNEKCDSNTLLPPLKSVFSVSTIFPRREIKISPTSCSSLKIIFKLNELHSVRLKIYKVYAPGLQ